MVKGLNEQVVPFTFAPELVGSKYDVFVIKPVSPELLVDAEPKNVIGLPVGIV